MIFAVNHIVAYAYEQSSYDVSKEASSKQDDTYGFAEEVYDFYAKEEPAAEVKTTEYTKDSIRVLVMNSDHSKSFHHAISLSSDSEMKIQIGEEIKTVSPGEVFRITTSDENLNSKIVIETSDTRYPIRVNSISRSQGTPSYFGRLEIIKRNDVLYLINVIDIESYLKYVVPSEMPSTYSLEALKAQAVTARTYAYAHIQNTGELAEYGAQVDDSVNFQVYNNFARTAATDRAVDETAGEVLRYQGKLISALFYSTSSGVSADGTIWGSDKSGYPYFESQTITRKKQNARFANEQEISDFLYSKQMDAYERDYTYYRWNVELSSKELEERIPEVGTISDISIVERGSGGIAQSIKVEGETGSTTISGQNEIRYRLGNERLSFRMNDGKVLSNMRTLPSAFITMQKEQQEDGSFLFHVRGGGYGHAVGMSQNGANEMAKSGMNYKDILKYYYNGVEIGK